MLPEAPLSSDYKVWTAPPGHKRKFNNMQVSG
jgi:hypothetical protein